MQQMFSRNEAPRAKPIKRMHVADAGIGCIQFICQHCGHNTGWVKDEWTVTENRRGHPCPICNARPRNRRRRHD